jgi:hypothetical protein
MYNIIQSVRAYRLRQGYERDIDDSSMIKSQSLKPQKPFPTIRHPAKPASGRRLLELFDEVCVVGWAGGGLKEGC